MNKFFVLKEASPKTQSPEKPATTTAVPASPKPAPKQQKAKPAPKPAAEAPSTK